MVLYSHVSRHRDRLTDRECVVIATGQSAANPPTNTYVINCLNDFQTGLKVFSRDGSRRSGGRFSLSPPIADDAGTHWLVTEPHPLVVAVSRQRSSIRTGVERVARRSVTIDRD